MDTPEAPVKRKRELADMSYTLAELLRSAIVRTHPGIRLARETESQQLKTIERWADPIDKLHRIDRCSWEDIRVMIGWAMAHSFWSGVIQSAENLRKHWDKMQGQRGVQTRQGQIAAAPGAGRHEPTPGEYAEGEQEL